MGIGISMERIDNKKNKVKYENLSDRSEKDKPWDNHRKDTDQVSSLYFQSAEFERYYERMEECSGRLEFNQLLDKETGEIKIKLSGAHFCRVRHCPVCQWRKTLMWKARFYKALPEIEKEYKAARWMFLTLTVENCDIKNLKTTLADMNNAFRKMVKRKHFLKYNLGFVKTTEITRSKDGTAHPHFHILLMMKSTYFKSGYLKTSDWAELWRDCLNVSYTPITDVRIVKPKATGEANRSGLADAVAETLKYAVKPADMTKDREWFHELTRQVFKLRFVSTGGVLKDLFKEETSEEDLLLLNEEEETDKSLGSLYFDWHKTKAKYRRKVDE
jgi:plasmid rolling circle replication initiator protein Rep